MQHSKYAVLGPNGEVLTHLNERLAIRQGVSDEQLEALKTSYRLRWILFEAAKQSLEEPLKLKMLAGVFDQLESEQQKLWNFKDDPNHHRFFDFPGCACPKHDNAERLGTPYKIYSEGCPIHGDRVTKVMHGRIMIDPDELPELSAEEKRQLHYRIARHLIIP